MSEQRKKIVILGTGYVGMASVVGLAELGWNVTGYDVMTDRVLDLRRGITPYREAGIEDALRRQLAKGRLTFETDHDTAVRDADLIVVCVGTPSLPDGSCDLSALWACVRSLKAAVLSPNATVVLRSTVPPGTSDVVREKLAGYADVVYAPEFLREGSALPDFLKPDRTVVGADSHEAAMRYASLFAAIDAPVMITTRINAELIKLSSNAFLATKITFANEVANLCDTFDADALEVLGAMGGDRRIGPAFLQPGIGFGGPCFEKDLKNYQRTAARQGIKSELVSATLRANDYQQQRIVDKLELGLESLRGKTIGVWGLAFKAGTDDVRDSLAVRIIEDVIARGATEVRAYDPAVHVATLPNRCIFADSALDAAQCDALVVLTEWPVFAQIPAAEIAARVKGALVVDGRNILDGNALSDAGILYIGVGRSARTNSVERPLLQAI